MRILAALACVLIGVAVVAVPRMGWAEQITLVYVSNIPEIGRGDGRGGLAALATLLRRERRHETPMLFIHGGDSLAPSALSAFDMGAHMIDLLNELEPDVMAVAKRELAFGPDALMLRAAEASFPLLSANLTDVATGKPLEGIAPRFVPTPEPGLPVGLTAVTSAEAEIEYPSPRIRLSDPVQTLERNARQLRADGARLVVAMADFDSPAWEDLLAANTVDVMLIASSRADGLSIAGRGIRLSLGSRHTYAAVLTLRPGTAADPAPTALSLRLERLSALPDDPALGARITEYQQRLSALMDVQLGRSRTALDTRRENLRASENAFGNLVADALRARTGADAALVNSGGIRGNRLYAAGTVFTRRDLQTELPFRNTLMTLTLTGRQIRQALENGLSRIEDRKGRFPQLSNMQVVYDPARPAGARVTSVRIGGRALIEDKEYTLATLDYLARGGDGYTVLGNARRAVPGERAVLIWEVVADYIARRGAVTPRVEGRLVATGD